MLSEKIKGYFSFPCGVQPEFCAFGFTLTLLKICSAECGYVLAFSPQLFKHCFY